MEHNRNISVVGLGYVGLPVAVALGKKQQVIGFDKNTVRISELKQQQYDRNNDLSADELKSSKVIYTSNPEDIKAADFYIIAVPTPLNPTKHPDLRLLIEVSEIVGAQLKKDDIVVYESTVYPGCTEEICVPVLEKASGMKCGKDFFVGYSPERINPGDKQHTFTTTKKIVSAMDKKTLDIVAGIYSSVISAGVHPVSTIKVAEAAKVIENTQRDLNISLINEIALILHKLDIDTQEVLSAAATKWNFLPFKPGLVGGHCIGVDPYYLTHKAQEVGYYPDVILAGRRINDVMGKFIAEQTIKKMIQLGIPVKRSRVLVMGITFKENIPDTRNSRVIDMINELKSYDVEVIVHDPIALPKSTKEEYNIDLKKWEDIPDVDVIILAVAHKQFIEMDKQKLKDKLHNRGLIMDVRSILDPTEFAETGIMFWRL